MCKIASKKLVSRPLVTGAPQKQSLLDPSTTSPSIAPLPLPLQLLTPPSLELTPSSLAASCPTNPGYFDLLPTPRFTPSALLLDSLDYTFPSPVPTVTPVATTTAAPVVISPHHFDQFIASTTSSSDGGHLNSGSVSPFESSSSDEEHDYHAWQTQPSSLNMEDLLDSNHKVHMEEEEEEDEEGIEDSSMATTSTTSPTTSLKKTTTASSCAPARTPLLGAKTGVAGISKKTVTSEEKRERNRLAAERYRKKGRDTISYLDQQREELTKRNSDLELRNEQLEREVAFLKETLAKHGLMVKGRC